ncbi:hypothetical protein [Brevibacterium sp. 239c]|nr:hypothetical protein [Brevibacterium sp. 239c]
MNVSHAGYLCIAGAAVDVGDDNLVDDPSSLPTTGKTDDWMRA